MAGNVWEWLADEAGSDGQYRQLRGGAWFYSAEFTRIDYNRFWRRPDHRQDVIGFRLCFSVPQRESR
jgi:formylglycine-generating enzyme required for sulfatase activity